MDAVREPRRIAGAVRAGARALDQPAAAGTVDPCKTHDRRGDRAREHPPFAGGKACAGESAWLQRRRLVDPCAAALAVHRGARHEERSPGRLRALLQHLQQRRDAVDVCAPVGHFVAAAGRDRVDHDVDGGDRPFDGPAVGHVDRQGTQRSGKPPCRPPGAEDLVAALAQHQAERGPDVAAAGNQDPRHSTVSRHNPLHGAAPISSTISSGRSSPRKALTTSRYTARTSPRAFTVVGDPRLNAIASSGRSAPGGRSLSFA